MRTAFASRSARRGRFAQRPARGDDGFTLIEAIVAVLLLAIVVLGFTADITASNTATRQAQARLQATLIGQQTLQAIDSAGWSTVAEGISCTTASSGPCTLAQNPGHMLQSGTDNCWYYGSPANKLLVSTVNESSSGGSGPIIPFATAAGSSYLPHTENGTTYNVTAVPVYNINAGLPSGSVPSYNVTCSQQLNDTVPNVPITVMVQVTWSVGSGTQSVGFQTTLYDSPALPPSISSCAVATAQQGGHVESHLSLPSSTYDSTPAAPGGAGEIFFIDEAPTTYTPTYCVTDSSLNTYTYGTCLAGPACPSSATGSCSGSNCPGYIPLTITYFGNSSSNPFLPASGKTNSGATNCTSVTNPDMTAVHGSFNGSGPNACQPPTAGTYCNTNGAQYSNNCPVEELWTLTLPNLSPAGNNIYCFTVAGWDHEGDFDSYSWGPFNTTSYTCPN